MNAAPMVTRCLELQNDTIPAPFIQTSVGEVIPAQYWAWPATEYCARCGVNHGNGLVYDYTDPTD